MRIFKALAPIVMIMIAVAYWINSKPKQDVDLSATTPVSQVSDVAPIEPMDFSLPDGNGREARLSSFKGKPILLNFWATWCPPCLEELPALLKFAEMAKKEFGLETIAVSIDENWSAVQNLFAEKKLWPQRDIPLTILMNPDAKVAAGYGTSRYPETYFIDRGFKIIRKFVGIQNWTSQEITQWIKEHSKSQ